jgi:hypothetical protein
LYKTKQPGAFAPGYFALRNNNAINLFLAVVLQLRLQEPLRVHSAG